MNRRLAQVFPCAALLAAVSLTAGCSGLLTSEQAPRQQYLLAPVQQPATTARTEPSTRLTLQVSAIPGLDTDRILALGADARLQQYSNARWPDHLPEVLASTLQRSLESTGWFASVELTDRADDGGWLLQLEARAFYGIRDSAGDTSSVRVMLAGGIDCGGERHRLELSGAQPVTEQRLASIVAAHQSSLDEATRRLFERIEQGCMASGGQ